MLDSSATSYLASCLLRVILYVEFIPRSYLELWLSILLQTACLLTFVVYFMAMYPEVGKRMREEVIQTHGLDGLPTYESLRSLKYSAYFVAIRNYIVSNSFSSACRFERNSPPLPARRERRQDPDQRVADHRLCVDQREQQASAARADALRRHARLPYPGRDDSRRRGCGKPGARLAPRRSLRRTLPEGQAGC